jgi:hypothetical protein
LEQSPLLSRQGAEPRRFRRWASWKTYAPTCAFIVLILGFHFFKAAWIKGSVAHGNLYSVKAAAASGFPVRPNFLDTTWWMRQLSRHPAMLQYLIERGADVNAPTRENPWAGNRRYGPSGPPYRIDQAEVIWTPLMAALAAGSVEASRILIEHGADVQARDSFGRTPMTIAISNCPQAIEMLLASGVDINEQTRFGTPLLIAARYQWFYPESAGSSYMPGQIKEKLNAVKTLLEKGADPNARDSEGRNALMVLSLEKRGEKEMETIAESLLNAGCYINASDNNGRTPLMYATQPMRTEGLAVVRLLLKRGADTDAQDHDGYSAFYRHYSFPDGYKPSLFDDTSRFQQELSRVLMEFPPSGGKKNTR